MDAMCIVTASCTDESAAVSQVIKSSSAVERSPWSI